MMGLPKFHHDAYAIFLVLRLAFDNVGDLCSSGMDVRLVDSTSFHIDQVLTNAITRQGSKHLVVLHKLQQA